MRLEGPGASSARDDGVYRGRDGLRTRERDAPSRAEPAGGPTRARGPPRGSIRWPPPLPGRVRWAWLLGTSYRGWRLEPLLRLLDGRVRPDARIASIGAGPGYDAARLARRRVAARAGWLLLDPQRGMWRDPRRLERIARAPFRAERIVGDAIDLPFRSETIDVVLSVGVLCCMTEAAIPGAVAETVRVLRPGGLLLFGVPKWRGGADEARFTAAGLVRLASVRAGRTLFEKPL